MLEEQSKKQKRQKNKSKKKPNPKHTQIEKIIGVFQGLVFFLFFYFFCFFFARFFAILGFSKNIARKTKKQIQWFPGCFFIFGFVFYLFIFPLGPILNLFF